MLFILLYLLGQRALSNSLYIFNASGLINFSRNINDGTNYSGTTVFLEADIDFSGGLSEQFEPIGKGYHEDNT